MKLGVPVAISASAFSEVRYRANSNNNHKFDIREAYLNLNLGKFEFRVGEQIVLLGGIQMDSIQPTTLLPQDFRAPHLSCDRLYFKLALTAKCSEISQCQCFTLIVFTANGFQRHALFLCKGGYFPIGYGREITIFYVPTADHSKCRGLYPSQRIASLAGDGQCTTCIDTHEPVGFASCLGGVIEIVVMASWLKIGKSFTNGFVRQ